MFPDDRSYTREHEWIRAENELLIIGITHHAQNEMGDLVFVEVPEKGQRVETGQPLGTVESVKAVSEIFSPVTGEIAAVNEALADRPELVNEDPHGSGWLVKIKVDDGAPQVDVMTAAEYAAFIETGG